MMFNKIITLSLNPVADITFYVNRYVPGVDNVVENELYDAAGKAVDVSRVLRSYEIANTALIVAGQEKMKMLQPALFIQKDACGKISVL